MTIKAKSFRGWAIDKRRGKFFYTYTATKAGKVLLKAMTYRGIVSKIQRAENRK